MEVHNHKKLTHIHKNGYNVSRVQVHINTHNTERYLPQSHLSWLLIPQAQNPYASHALPPAISEKSHALDLSVYASSNAEHPPQLPDMR